MHRLLPWTERHFVHIAIGYLVVQLLLLLKLPMPFSSDSKYFYNVIQACIQQQAWYPLQEHHYHDYLVAPVFLNLLIAMMKIWNSPYVIALWNIALNMLQLMLMFRLFTKIWNRQVAVYACLLYMVYLGNLGMVLMNFNDLFFTVLITAAVLLFLQEKFLYALLSGMVAGLAYGVRPVALALIAALLLTAILYRKKHPALLTRAPGVIAGFAVAILTVGLLHKAITGTFVYTSNFTGLNLVIGACDDARGGFQSRVFEPGGSGYIENIEQYTHTEREAFWQKQALQWMQEHPVKWLLLMPVKFIRMYISDDYSVSRLFFQEYTIYHVYRHYRYAEPMPAGDRGHSTGYFVVWWIVQVLHHLFFYVVVYLSVRQVYRTLKSNVQTPAMVLLLLFCLFGFAMTVMVYGEARYKYPYLFVHFAFAAVFIFNAYRKKENDKQQSLDA